MKMYVPIVAAYKYPADAIRLPTQQLRLHSAVKQGIT